MKSPKHENYYDNKFHIFDDLKMEAPDIEVPHLDCNVKNEIVSEDKELSKFIDQNPIKHEVMENGLPLNITIKTERIVEGETLDNNKNMCVPYKLTIQDVQLNSDERLLNNKCGEQYPSPEQLGKHRIQCNVNTSKEHICKLCGAFFKMRGYLTKHMRNIHYDYGRTFDCWCGKQFRSPVRLYEHKWQHEHKSKDTDNDRFQCDSCQKVFKRRRNLVVHIKSAHYDYGRTFDCWCGKKYRSPVQLKLHKKSNHVIMYGGYMFYL